MQEIFKMCAPCCDECPTVSRDGETVTITDPTDPDRGIVSMPLATFVALLGDERVGAFDPDREPARSLPKFSRDGVSLAAGWTEARGWIVIFLRGAHSSMVVRIDEWNALFGSWDARRAAIAKLNDDREDVPFRRD